MSVYPRSDGIYAYDFQIQSVRFCGTTGVRNRREAEEAEQRERETAKRKLALLKEQRTGPLTISAAFDRFWTEVGDGYAGTYGDLVWSSLAWMLRQLGPDTLLRDIGPSQITTLIARRRAPGPDGRRPSNATVNRSVVELLRRIMRRASRQWEQDIKSIEWRDQILPEPRERIRELRQAEEDRLVGQIRDDYLPAIRFLLVTGLRKSEMIGLRWSHVDWAAQTVAVLGKGQKADTIPLTAEMRAIMTPLRGHHPEVVFTYVGQRPRLNPKSGKTIVKGMRYPITLSGLNTAWRRHGARAAGIEDFRLHDLRHTAATRLLRDSGNLKLVQRLLRHEEIATTSKYAHADQDDLRAAMERVEKSRKKSRARVVRQAKNEAGKGS